MILEIPRENIDSLLDRAQVTENSEAIRAKVIQAHNIQQKRFLETNITNNSQISSKDIDKYIYMESRAEEFLKN